MKENNIIFTTEDGEQIPFYVIEQTMIAGIRYLLVTESGEEEQEAEAFIMKEMTDDDSEMVYELVDDDHELSAISKVFAELLDDTDIEL